MAAFQPVQLGSLRVDTFTPFDLYVSQGERKPYVLYREKNPRFTEATRKRLERNNVVVLYVPAHQSEMYRTYIEDNLGNILSDEGVTMAEKSQILYDSAMSLSKEMLENPRSGDLFTRCEDMVRHEVAFVIDHEDAFENLIRVTSYDYYTYTHSVNVSLFCIAIAHALGYNEEKIFQLGNGALLHDIGKTMVPPEILNCPGRLSDDAWLIMRLHPVYGYNMLKRQGCRTGLVLDIVRHHHEKLSGRGYPDGLGARDVSEYARISTIADVFDALTTRRSYKEALPAYDAFHLMQNEMGAELDASVLKRLIGLMGAAHSLHAAPDMAV